MLLVSKSESSARSPLLFRPMRLSRSRVFVQLRRHALIVENPQITLRPIPSTIDGSDQPSDVPFDLPVSSRWK